MLLVHPSLDDARAILPAPGASALRNFHAASRALVAPHFQIYQEGQPKEAAYRLIDGCVILSQTFPDGRRQIVDILGPGRLFGFASGPLNSCSAEARTYSEIERLPRKVADRLSAEEARVSLARCQTHITLLGRKTAREKVASALIDLADQFPRKARLAVEEAVPCFTLFVTRSDLGDWLGLTIETVSRFINAFRREGLIDFKHPEIITITDRPAMLHAAGGPVLSA